MTDVLVTDFHDEAWLRLPVEMRRAAAGHVVDVLKASTLEDIADMHAASPDAWPARFPAGLGTRLRAELELRFPPHSSLPGGTWDDYWMQAAEAAAGVRGIQDEFEPTPPSAAPVVPPTRPARWRRVLRRLIGGRS